MLFPEAHDVRHTVEQALSLVYRNDLYLIRHSVHERSLTFRLGFYLQQLFPDWDVDCEYNKNCKTLWHNKYLSHRCHAKPWLDCAHCKGETKSQCTVFPDVIVHKRGTKHNLLVIEAKKNAVKNAREEDIAKIKAYLEESTLHYQYGLFINFKSSLELTRKNLRFFPESQFASDSFPPPQLPEPGLTNNEVK